MCWVLPFAALGAPLVLCAQRPPARPPAPTTPRDSAQQVARERGVALAPVEIRGSIVPAAGPTIGSGVPARVSIVTARQIEAWKPRVLPDALATQPGVSLYDDLGTPWKLNLSTRGFSAGPTVGLPSGVSVFLDGVRQNEPAAQEVNFDLLPLEYVAHVETLAGSASLLGPNSLGGAINLVTARGDGPPGGEFQVTGGSFGSWEGSARASGRTASNTSYFAAGGYERERGWRDATSARNYNGFLNVGRLGERAGFSVQAYGAQSRAETAGSLPESIFRNAPRTNFTPGDFEDIDAQQLALSAYAPVAAGRGGVNLYVRRSGAVRFNVNQPPDPDVRSRTSSLTLGATADWRRALVNVGRGALAIRLGVDGTASQVRARIYAVSAASQAVDDESGLTTDVRSPGIDLASYALADYQVGRVTVSGGGRFDFVRVPFRNQIRTADNTTNDYRNFSPRIGASIALTSGASMYVSAGRSFRAPAILELGCADPEAACPLPFALGDDPALRPVRATAYEVGAQWTPGLTGGALTATFSAYHTAVRDEIFFVASKQALFSGYFTNLDRTRREGVELGLQGSGSRLSWYANYAWTRATFRSEAELFSVRGSDEFTGSPLAGDNDVEPGSRLPLVPDHQLKAGGVLQLGTGVSLGIDTRYTGRQWLRGDEANVTAPLTAYSVTNARLGYSRGPWEVSGVMTNVFDSRSATFGTFNENRQTSALERFLTPINGRAFKLTLQRAFGRSMMRRQDPHDGEGGFPTSRQGETLPVPCHPPDALGARRGPASMVRHPRRDS